MRYCGTPDSSGQNRRKAQKLLNFTHTHTHTHTHVYTCDKIVCAIAWHLLHRAEPTQSSETFKVYTHTHTRMCTHVTRSYAPLPDTFFTEQDAKFGNFQSLHTHTHTHVYTCDKIVCAIAWHLLHRAEPTQSSETSGSRSRTMITTQDSLHSWLWPTDLRYVYMYLIACIYGWNALFVRFLAQHLTWRPSCIQPLQCTWLSTDCRLLCMAIGLGSY